MDRKSVARERAFSYLCVFFLGEDLTCSVSYQQYGPARSLAQMARRADQEAERNK